jgi:hypothetical protein
VKYYLRKKDSKVVDGPLAPHDIQSLIPSKFDLENTLAVAANGQSMGTLLTKSQWEPLALVLKREDINPNDPTIDHRPLDRGPIPQSVPEPEFVVSFANTSIAVVIVVSLWLILSVIDSPLVGGILPSVILIGGGATVVCFFIVGVKNIVLLLAKIAADRGLDLKQKDQEI